MAAVGNDDLADQSGGALDLDISVGDVLYNNAEVSANVNAGAMHNVTSGQITGNNISGLDGMSTVMFNSGANVAASFNTNVIVNYK
ncbi:MAG: hypothetical protein HC834_04965 [Rhodospirillales bacterium]|nr:hypothetical protein [Rhodospirillales bacterium]